jgi:hypothetical protein
MDARRYFYLNSKQDDFMEPRAEMGQPGPTGIPYVMPANDNAAVRGRLSARSAGPFFVV